MAVLRSLLYGSQLEVRKTLIATPYFREVYAESVRRSTAVIGLPSASDPANTPRQYMGDIKPTASYTRSFSEINFKMVPEEQSVPVTYIRGGTSKALFFHEKDIPKPGILRDKFLQRMMGSPDIMQIDGIGGSRVVTSKVAIVRSSDRADADVDYTFAQVAVTEPFVGYTGNCGNISAGVGPFAIDEGLVTKFRAGASIDPSVRTQEVRIYNTGTKKLLISHVPIDSRNGKALESGDFAIDGAPGKGAAILMDYRNTIGASRGKGLLPTGRCLDVIDVAGSNVDFTICDIANICIFASAEQMGISGHEAASTLDKDQGLIARCKELRGKGAKAINMCQDWEQVDTQSPMLPMVVLVAPAVNSRAHFSARLFLDSRCHDSMAGTGAICTAACSRVPGSVVFQQLKKGAVMEHVLQIEHPLGIMPVSVETGADVAADSLHPEFTSLSFVRTSRRIMDGRLYVPDELWTDMEKASQAEPNATIETANGNGIATMSNGVNGTSTGLNGTHADQHIEEKDIPVTRLMAEFVSQLHFADLSTDIKHKLRELLLDYIGVGSAASKAESTEPFYKAVLALGGASGMNTVFTKGQKFSPQYAALLNGALAHTFDFDDTYADGVLHPGVSVISAALAQGEADKVNSESFITALAAGYEICCRLGFALGITGYDRGFHNTATAGIFGAVAAIAKLKNLSASVTQAAFGIAGSKAAGSMQYLENGAWNKRLHPGFAAHDAFVCIAFAEAGVIGASKSIEGKYGILNSYCGKPNYTGIVDNLGTSWKFTGTALKPFPACRMTHGLIELAASMADASNTKQRQEVHSMTVALAPGCWPIVGVPTVNKIRPDNIVDAQFSAYYQTAVAWLRGKDLGWAAYDLLDDAEVRDLARRITCVSDPGLDKLGVSLSVRWSDGTETKEELMAPLGEEGRPFVWEAVQRKYFSLAENIYGRKRAAQIRDMVENIDTCTPSTLTALL